MITWPDLDAALHGRAGWRRVGRTWRGAPCPSCGGGTQDTAWVGPGKTAEFVAGCNAGCNGLEIARALVPDSDPSPVVWREPRTRAARAPTPPSQGQPSPELPAGAAGAILYRFGAPDDGGTLHALQAEAVNADGARLAFATAGKRPSVAGSTFTHGARVFLARDGGPGVSLCESVLDALAVVCSPWGAPDGEAVIAAAGTSGLQAAAVRSWPGPVTVWAQDDKPSVLRAVRLGAALHTAGRAVTIQRPADGLRGTDWADVAQLEHDERKGIQHE